jgi:outer membrane murein-binding lipoprotein Lpp
MEENMVRKKFVFLAALFCIIMLSGCTDQNHTLKDENTKLKAQITQLQQDLKTAKNSNNTLQNININYMDYSFKKRFVEKESKILGLPYDESVVLNPIGPNTVVTVIDAATVENDVWLYVAIPVYDSPVNMKGWIRESESSEYTKDKVKSVQSDVTVKAGADVYEADDFSSINLVKPTKADSSDKGRIEEKKEGYVCISCPGGRTIWVSEKSVVYPAVE